MSADDRRPREPFVVFGPEQARKGREETGAPEPPVVAEAPPDAGLLRRIWARLSTGHEDGRKLWGSATTERDR